MQQSTFRGFGKTVLTILGIVLLLIFGTRAASQASSLAAVGSPAAEKSKLLLTGLDNTLAISHISSSVTGQQLLSSTQPVRQNTTENSSANGKANKKAQVSKAAASIKGEVQKVAADTEGLRATKPAHVK